MKTIQTELNRIGIITANQLNAINHIHDRVRILDNQLDHLYNNPLTNCLRISILEGQKEILNKC